MFRRKLLAAAMSVAILLTTTAVQAAPATTATLTAEWTSGAEGDISVEVGSVTVTQAVNGDVTLSFDVTRTIACLGVAGASTREVWQAIDAPASLAVKNNLSSATATATVTGGFSVTSNCPGVILDSGDVGLIIIEAVATARTVRERTADGIRILTRSVDVAIVAGSLIRQAPGALEKSIG
ncbi:MAG TPA: hypothetical protein VM848_17090 [Acidimicrobiia bacterium]|nr:hypothetical protein [Acidimicrobiia bacterium]